MWTWLRRILGRSIVVHILVEPVMTGMYHTIHSGPGCTKTVLDYTPAELTTLSINIHNARVRYAAKFGHEPQFETYVKNDHGLYYVMTDAEPTRRGDFYDWLHQLHYTITNGYCVTVPLTIRFVDARRD